MKKIEGRFFISFSSQLSSGDASDSICPKGWGIAGASGDGSYLALMSEVYIGQNRQFNKAFRILKEYTFLVNLEEILIRDPLSFSESGYYSNPNGSLDNDYSAFWEKGTGNNLYSRHFSFSEEKLQFNPITNKGRGFSVRCVAK